MIIFLLISIFIGSFIGGVFAYRSKGGPLIKFFIVTGCGMTGFTWGFVLWAFYLMSALPH